ncbi:MAG: cyanophycinase [Bacteroidia bacterium]
MRIPRPKGILIPIGGAEDKKDKKDILRRVVQECRKKHPKVCVITLASNLPHDVARDYRDAFKTLGITKLSIIHYHERSQADTPVNIKKLKECNVVMFSGGDQLRLGNLLGGTKLIDLIKSRYYDEEHFVIAGTSAGAAAMSDTMIISGSSQDAMIKGELELTNGLDLISSVFIDTHFTERGRIGRVIQTVTCNPGVLGLGLGEDTAVVIIKGEEMEVVGSGLVIIIDGKCIDYTDLTDITYKTPITVEGIKMHVLGPGKKFIISERKIKREDMKK